MLLRLSKPQGYLLLSISPTQRARQAALECIPLVMEPVSQLYTDPVVVLDFQSLYPSIIIAYNMCYSTCLGKIPDAAKPAATAATNTAADVAAAKEKARVDAAQDALSQSSAPLSPSQHSEGASQSQRAPAAVAAGFASPSASGAAPARPSVLDCLSPLAATSSSSFSGSPPLLDDGPPAPTPPSTVALGGTRIPRDLSLLGRLQEQEGLFTSANGVMFARRNVRQGILPRMLAEILATRVMVKRSMSRPEVLAHRGLHRLLNARQFGLKLISNVTYGYTSAGYSGRMPCAEIADAIVQTGRDTLEAAIGLVEATGAPWGPARVVYGDTDSLFVLLPGRTRQQAFEVGHAIAAAVTAANPQPVKLQMDKVYQPCCLLSKKRYVGYRYDGPGDNEAPTLEAKGIESVRRDGCPALVKTMTTVLRMLFSSPADLTLVRSYLERQWSRIWRGLVPIADFVFAKEVRMGTYRVPPLGALLASRLAAQDARLVPLHGERVPYVIVDGGFGGGGVGASRLSERLAHPLALSLRPDLFRPCAAYYAENILNRPLGRILDLLGIDIKLWFQAWHRPRRQALASPIVVDDIARGGAGANKKAAEMQAARPPAAPAAAAATTSAMTTPSYNRSRGGARRPGGSLSHGLARSAAGGGGGASSAALSSSSSFSLGGGQGQGHARPRTIDQYYASQHCPLCDRLTQRQRTFCEACMVGPDVSLASISSSTGLGANLARGAWVRLQWSSRVSEAQSSYAASLATCRACVGDGRLTGGCGGAEAVAGPMHLASSLGPISLAQSPSHLLVPCVSLECPNQFRRQRLGEALNMVMDIESQLDREQAKDERAARTG